MAYTPNLQDTQEAIGYTPTLADTQEVLGAGSSANQAQPIPQDFNLTAPVLAGLGRAGSNLLEDVGRLVKTNVTRQLGNMIVPGLGNLIQSRGEPLIQGGQAGLDLANKMMTGATGPQQAIAGLTQTAPYFLAAESGLPAISRLVPGISRAAEALSPIASALGRIPVLSRLGRYATRGAIAGGETGGLQGLAEGEGNDQTNRLQSALQLAQANAQTGAEFGAGLAPIGSAAKTGISKGLAALRAPAEAERMVGEAAGKLPQDVMNKQNNEILLQNADKKQAIASTKYQDVADTAEAMGFASDKNPEGQIKIKPYPQLTQTLDKIPDNIGINKKLIATIGRYKNNPTYENAHELQSHLGKEAARIDAKLVKNPTDDNTVDALRDARGAVNTRIEQAFNRTGNKNLIKKYKNASDYYKTEVRPYHDKPEIYRMMQGKQYPHDVLNVISEHDPKGYNDKIRQDIKKNPFQSRSFMAQALQKHVNPSNAEKGLTLDDIINGYKDIPTEIKTIGKNTQLAKNMGALEQAAKTRKTIAKTARGTKIAGTTLGGIGASIWGLKKILG